MEGIGEEEIRGRLRAEIEVLKGSRNRLAGLRAAIPPSSQETSEEDLFGSFDLPTETRTVIEIQLKENFKALLKSLRAAADYQPGAASPSSEPVRLDLTADAEAMGPVVYALVVQDNFTARRSEEEAGKILVPPYTAEQVGLEVGKFRGRWLASWLKPGAPKNAPEDERWEVLLIEEDEKQPGSLIYREL